MDEQPVQGLNIKNEKPKNMWKIVGISFILIAIILAGAVVYLILTKPNEPTLNNPTSNQQTENELDNISYLTHVTNRNQFKFDYPSNWNISVETHSGMGKTSDDLAYNTIVTTAAGYKIYLLEDPGGGIGGICFPEEMSKVTVHKEADSRTNGLAVISHGPYLYLSGYTGEYDTPVSECDIQYTQFFEHNINTPDALVSFGSKKFLVDDGLEQALPSASEYKEVVKMLASFRQ